MTDLKYQNLKENFEKNLKDPSCVRVETFYEKLKTTNNAITWDIKTEEEFIHFLGKSKEPLEVLAEGYRCLSQIYINLLRDFDIFNKYPIRKYSSAFNYISKIERFRELLKGIGYEEGDMTFELKVEKIKDKDKITKVALNLLINFMEVMELFKLHHEGNDIVDEIDMRKNNIKKELESIKEANMTDDEILKMFEICTLCESMINNSGECIGCSSSVTEFEYAWKFKDFLVKTFKVDVSKIKEPKRKDDIGEDDLLLEDNKKDDHLLKDNKKDKSKIKNEKKDDGNWSCVTCTFLNSVDNLNCTCCGDKKK